MESTCNCTCVLEMQDGEPVIVDTDPGCPQHGIHSDHFEDEEDE